MLPIVLSGGSGTRLWPVSRTKWPKQFCDLFEESLQSLTLKRVARLGTPWVLTCESLRGLTDKKLKEINFTKSKALYEPQAKNTAPAIAFLCKYLLLQGQEEEIVGVFPADQLIEKEDEFIKAVSLAVKEAENDKIVTLGIQPTFPATGFGYIQIQKQASMEESGFESFKVVQFHEKPNQEKAAEFLKNKSFQWNAGIFIFKVKVMAEVLKNNAPDVWSVADQLKADLSNLTEVYDDFRNVSIDYAVIENLREDCLRCIPCDIGWNDVGSWDAMAEMTGLQRPVQTRVDHNSKNNFLHPLPEKTYAFVSVEDLIVVDTKDALLISKKGQSQDVKNVVEKLKVIQPPVVNEHIFEERPWGRFEVLKDTERYKSKVIHVLPSSQISYQSHAKREEHWLITQGRGEVVLEDKIIPVQAGVYVKIPLGARHRIRNTGREVIEFIEVQMGTYFGEDDIVRYQDDYKRV